MRRAALSLCIVAGLAIIQRPATAAAVKATTVRYHSPSVGRDLNCRIILPASYESSSWRYPVLYLLHGFSGDYTNWIKQGIEKAAEPYEMIVVLPDGGNGWWINWAVSERGQKNHWEDALIVDLVGYVETHYRTIAAREGRAICGLSLGGYGAIALGLRHPGMFCTIGGTGAGLQLVRNLSQTLNANPNAVIPDRKPADKVKPGIGMEDFDSQEERTPYGRMFTNVAQAEAYDPFELILNVPRDSLPHIYLDCGTEDSFLLRNQEFVALMMDHDIAFTYAQSPGEHKPEYWSREISHILAVQYEMIRRSLARKAPTASATR
jgi:S-formylglutathione hydrolase FrmB